VVSLQTESQKLIHEAGHNTVKQYLTGRCINCVPLLLIM